MKRKTKKTTRPKIGRKLTLWFDGGLPDKSSRILSVRKYTGKFPEFFNWTVCVTSARVPAGIEIAL